MRALPGARPGRKELPRRRVPADRSLQGTVSRPEEVENIVIYFSTLLSSGLARLFLQESWPKDDRVFPEGTSTMSPMMMSTEK